MLLVELKSTAKALLATCSAVFVHLLKIVDVFVSKMYMGLNF